MATISSAIFKEYDIRGPYGSGFDEPAAYALGVAIVRHHKAKKAVVARDVRAESGQLLPALITGMQAAGARVTDLGVTATPLVFFAVRELRADVGVMATASHNPLGYAGFKIVNRAGLPVGLRSGLRAIARLARAVKVPVSFAPQPAAAHDIAAAYYAFITKFVSLKQLVGTSVVIDARHGSAAAIAHYCVSRLPLRSDIINTEVARRPTPHGFNPLLPSNHRNLRWKILTRRADFGVMFDGDGDRCVFFDERGRMIPPYYLNCLLAKIIAERFPGSLITIDARLPVGISEVIAGEEARPLICRSGYANIMQRMVARRSVFGCENSAHYFFSTKLIGARQGQMYTDALIPVLLVASYLHQQGIKLSQLIKNFSTLYPISGEINIEGVDAGVALAAVKAHYPKVKMTAIDGVSLFADDWFANVRPSKTEPLVRLNVEARELSTVRRVKAELTRIIRAASSENSPSKT